MLRYCALMSLFCSTILVTAFSAPGPAWADEAPTPSVEEKTEELKTSEEEKTAEVTPMSKEAFDALDMDAYGELGDEEKKAADAYAVSDPSYPAIETKYALDNLILFLCAVLVIFMQPGFALVEVGLNASKNAVNILFKNVIDLCLGVALYFFIGYNLMYPGGYGNGFLNFDALGSMVSTSAVGPTAILKNTGAGGLNLFGQVDFLFQVAFAATAATIVSGAVAGRLQFKAYLIYTILLTGLVYPISGFWKWGGGWLSNAEGSLAMEWFGGPFYDFAGSLVVHAVGGFAGLAGAIVLGPRIGRFSADGKPHAMPGSNMTFAALGVFILWTGWYGFNPGSYLCFTNEANVNATMTIAVNTTLAAAAGGVVAMMLSWMSHGKPDLSMALNGILGGLVGITANCDQVSNISALIIGAVAGGVIIGAVKLLDILKIDDPVGAFPVHGACGVWAGIATAIFGTAADCNWGSQLVGTIVIPIWAFVTMFILFSVLKVMGILRVSPEEESVGLDIGEHGMTAYNH